MTWPGTMAHLCITSNTVQLSHWVKQSISLTSNFEELNDVPTIRIAQVFEVFEVEAWTYIVMEYISSCWFAFTKQIVDAVALLLEVDPPVNAKPRPVGGGLMHHILFKTLLPL